jgi:hypothetical protein
MSQLMLSLLVDSQDTGYVYNPGDPGSPSYRGAMDYPNTIYQGYPGSSRYIWSSKSPGYPFINTDQLIPGMEINKKKEFFVLTSKYKIKPLLILMLTIYIIYKIFIFLFK